MNAGVCREESRFMFVVMVPVIDSAEVLTNRTVDWVGKMTNADCETVCFFVFVIFVTIS